MVIRNHCEEGVRLTGHPVNGNNNKDIQASVFPLDTFKSGFAARTAQLIGLRGVESKARFSSLSGGALATRGMPTGLGQIKAVANGRRIHSGANNTSSLMSVLSASRLLGRLLHR